MGIINFTKYTTSALRNITKRMRSHSLLSIFWGSTGWGYRLWASLPFFYPIIEEHHKFYCGKQTYKRTKSYIEIASYCLIRTRYGKLSY
jgi:hypothetical protein